MRPKKDVLLVISFTIIILGVISIFQFSSENITGYTAGSAKICVGSTPSLVPIGNLTAPSGIPFYHDVNHTIENSDPVRYTDNTNLFDIDLITGEISFIPEYEDFGNYTIMIRLNNTSCLELGDLEELNFEITPGNRAPVLDTIENKTVVEDNELAVTIHATDPDGDNISYACNTSLFTVGETTGGISWFPENEHVGLHWFDCNATDDYGAYDSQMFYVNVTNANDNPRFLDNVVNFTVENGNPLYESTPFYAEINATDDDGDTIEFSDDTTLFDISVDGIIIFTPTDDKVGNHSVNITLKDIDDEGSPLGGHAVETFYFEILAVNDAPVLTPIGAQTAQAGKSFTLDVRAADEEDGSDGLEGNLTFFDDTELFNISSTTGEISFTPTDAQVNNYTINISVTDRGIPEYGLGNATASETISFTITEANKPPNITSYTPETPFSMQTGETQDFTIIVEDPDGGFPDADWFLNGLLVQEDNMSLTYTYTFSPSSAETYNITVVVTDGELDDSQEWSITVTGTPVTPSPGGAGGEGSGGGGGYCKEVWVCTDWSTCMVSDIQIRVCKDLHSCGKTTFKPPEVRPCIFTLIPSCFDGILNQDEILIDCGGECNQCPHCSDNICNQGEQCETCQEDPDNPRCPRDVDGSIMPDCGGPCPSCPKIEQVLQPQTTNWKTILMNVTKISIIVLLILFILLIIIIKIIRHISKKALLTEQEKKELGLVNKINDLVTFAEKTIDMKDLEQLKLACANIEGLYNSLSSTKNKKKIYPKIKRLKRAIRIGF